LGGLRNKMVKVAYIFPGQGAQYVGMGKTLYNSFPKAKEIFDQANDILGYDIKKLCFEGPLGELSKTVNSQPAILVHSIAALRALEDSGKDFTPFCALGLSVGEYIALVASGAASYKEGLKLIQQRARFMEEASKQNPGKMVAVMNVELGKVEEICKEAEAEVANLNCPGQVVVSGSPAAINKVVALAQGKYTAKSVILNISGAFHSSLMLPAAEKLSKEIEKVNIKKPAIPMIFNATAKFESDPAIIRKNLVTQLTKRTLWEESIKLAAQKGVTTFLEIGPGKVLKGLMRRINPKLTVQNFDTVEDFSAVKTTA